MIGQGILFEDSTQSTQVAPPATGFQVQHIHFGLIGCRDHKSAVTWCRALTPREVKNLARLRRLIWQVSWCTTPVAPTDMADNLRMLDPFYSPVKRLDSPVLKTIGPGEFVKLDEIRTHRVNFQNILVDGFGYIHGPIPTRLVVQVVGGLREDLDAGVLDLDRLVRGPLERPGLLDHHLAAPFDLLG